MIGSKKRLLKIDKKKWLKLIIKSIKRPKLIFNEFNKKEEKYSTLKLIERPKHIICNIAKHHIYILYSTFQLFK